MERLIVICVSLFLTFNAAPYLFIMTAFFIEELKMQGLFPSFLILATSGLEIILFFMAIVKIGDKIIIKKETKTINV